MNFKKVNRTTLGFGPHLMLDLWECNKKKLTDLTHAYFLLDSLPSKIGMTKIAPPQVLSYPGKEGSFDKGGISGYVLIAESHITLHTFEEQGHAFVDIFSCKKFDIDNAVNILVNAFEAKRYKKIVSDRGEEFPKEISLATEIVKQERKSTQNGEKGNQRHR